MSRCAYCGTPSPRQLRRYVVPRPDRSTVHLERLVCGDRCAAEYAVCVGAVRSEVVPVAKRWR